MSNPTSSGGSADSYHRPTPAVDVIPSEELLNYVHPSLLDIELTDSSIKQVCIGATAMACLVIFVSFHIFGTICLPFYRRMPSKHKTFMCLAVIRGCYGIFGMVFGGYCLLAYTNLDRDVVFGRSATSTLAMYITVGFFIFELSAVVISDMAFGTLSKMLIVHHGLGLISYMNAIQGQENHSFGTKALLLEMSTPFSCLCYVLLKAGMEKSVLWKVNQIILVHTFHVRSVVECYLWYVTYNNWDYIVRDMPAVSFYLLYTTLSMVTFVMTPYWGYKKTQQLFNPVDWNFQESRNAQALAANGNVKKMI
ncbi:protein CLN8 [Elysia marginata]|uniref:Protein CLN8 n=1 Tax=Elysia marginata TaxID=1093978 RepID=A0AAV4F8U7_9GAST|nr:protein CLN8 [Elysia marginata]